MAEPQARGFSRPAMRTAECKDCLREIREGKRDEGTQWFSYPEAWATGQLDRGGSRSDRCREHRKKHQHNIAGMAVAYIDLATVGEVADRVNPTGPLGGLGSLPEAHGESAAEPVDLGKFGFGMDESHIRRMLESLSHLERRVLIVKAGTGTGKSTYMPYRLLDPPDGCYRLIDNGPIIVTEPRVQATVGVAEFVGGVMSGAGGVGPGFPVGYQAGGDKQHDAACQLVFVTDGTMINWLREGRLSQIGTVIVDEAHERSTNIDFILGYLKRELPRYPHLRVIVTSATFNADFYQQYFGGEAVAGKIDVPAVKTIGYGWPLFPDLDAMLPEEAHLAERWSSLLPQLKLRDHVDVDALVEEAWPAEAPALKEDEVANPPTDVGFVEDLHATTRALLPLRFQDQIPILQWKTRMPEVLGRFVVQLAKGLDKAGIYGDILGFLPTGKNIEEACDIIRAGVGDGADVFALLSSLPADEKRQALEARKKGDRRKIVVSTNLAETSLTVEGVRFVVDSGLIAQSEWDPAAAQGGIRTKPHSQAGIRQRWGRVGRKSPGWVFPLYTKGQLIELSEDTDPGSTRDNLEQLIMTAKLGGIDDVVGFDWPAAFLPEPPVVLDATALEARDKFVQELARANEALQQGGAVDAEGHPTSFGKELSRFSALGSASCAVAVMYADRLGCVPEVATILALLHERPLTGTTALLLDRPEWPDEWRYEAATRHRALASACEDDAEMVLQLCAGWERADPDVPPWDESPARARWARRWWVNDDVLRAAADTRREILASLSPAMKEEVKRFIEPALLRRARGAISRAMAGLEYQRIDNATYRAITEAEGEDDGIAILETSSTLTVLPDRIIPLTRRTTPVDSFKRLSNIVTFEPWALEGTDARPTGPRDAMRLLALAARHARADTTKDLLGATVESWPAGQRLRISFSDTSGEVRRVGGVHEVLEAFATPDEVTAEEQLAAVVVVDEDDTAQLADAAPELDTSWPSLNPEEPDTETFARRQLLDSREVEAVEAACGSCPRCLVGEPEACENKLADEGDPAIDVLEDWRNRATLGVDVSAPLVEVRSGAVVDGAWYEVAGYRITESAEPVVVLEEDWRPAGDTRGPAEHPDLAPGDFVELIVGPLLRDHRDDLRVLHRQHRGGRFLLREAHSSPNKQDEFAQLAVSLSRRYQGLLGRLTEGASLTGSVVPRKQRGFVTVTLLELLQQHFERGNEGLSQRFEVEFRNGRTGPVPFYPGVVVSEPNRNGYVDVELLVRDTELGIVHGVAFATDLEDDTVVVPPVGSPVWFRLSSEPAKLPLRDVELDPIRELAEREASLRLPDADGDADDDSDDASGVSASEADQGSTTDHTVGGMDSVLLSRRPVPRHVAQALLDLCSDADWSFKVWRFWAQSRYLRGDREDTYRVGENATAIEYQAELRPELPPAPQLSLEEVQERYGKGSTVDATVRNVSDDGSRAWLTISDGTNATVVKGAVGPRGVPDLRSVLFAGLTLSAKVSDVREHREQIQVDLDLRETDLDLGDAGGPVLAAEITVPASTVGSVIGKGGERIRRLKSAPGIIRCELDGESAVLRLEGESDEALRAVLEELAGICESAEGRMSVPGGKHGLLIGKQGATKARMLEEAGCTWANPVKDSHDWEIRAASESAVRRFVELARAVVPGCTAEVRANSLSVRDVSDSYDGPIVDWRTHRFRLPPQVDRTVGGKVALPADTPGANVRGLWEANSETTRSAQQEETTRRVSGSAARSVTGTNRTFEPSQSPSNSADDRLDRFGFGMKDSHIRTMLGYLENDDQRVLVVKAELASGKSTFMPWRLYDPPEDCFRLSDLGPVVVTSPSEMAVLAVGEFVGKHLSRPEGVGPGYPVGYETLDMRHHDAACRLIYVTEGVMVRWMQEGRLGEIGTVIVDEAHQRSPHNIYILEYLKRNLERYPDLRIVVTSSFLFPDFYVDYFTGHHVHHLDDVRVPVNGLVVPTRTWGYGFPLFPDLDAMVGDSDMTKQWNNAFPNLPLREAYDDESFVTTHWTPQLGPPLGESELAPDLQFMAGTMEDLQETTRKLIRYRFRGPAVDPAEWEQWMPSLLTEFVAALVPALDDEGIFGDILAFLPIGAIEQACDLIRSAVEGRADVLALHSGLTHADMDSALTARQKGDKRKIVVSTKLGDTALTVQGVRFVVDSGLACQDEWGAGGATTPQHGNPQSQVGTIQRWSRVGRIEPGWVFPLYTKAQFLKFPIEDPLATA